MLKCLEKDEHIPLSDRIIIKITIKEIIKSRIEIKKTLEEIPSILSVRLI